MRNFGYLIFLFVFGFLFLDGFLGFLISLNLEISLQLEGVWVFFYCIKNFTLKHLFDQPVLQSFLFFLFFL